MKLALLVLSVLFFPNILFASFQTARSLSFAGAGGVSAEAVDAAFLLNPATLSLKTSLESGAGFNRGDFLENQDQRQYYFWAKDSVSSAFKTRRNNRARRRLKDAEGFPFAAAFAYEDTRLRGALGRVDYKIYHVALSKVFLKRLSLGTAFRYIDGERGFHNFYGNLGAVWKFSKRLDFGLSWLNFAKKQNLQELVLEQDEALRLGASYKVNGLAVVYLDLERGLEEGLKKTSYGAALEIKVRKYFAFRLAGFHKAIEDSLDLGLGLSFLGPKLNAHYGFRQDLDSRAALHSVDFSLPF